MPVCVTNLARVRHRMLHVSCLNMVCELPHTTLYMHNHSKQRRAADMHQHALHQSHHPLNPPFFAGPHTSRHLYTARRLGTLFERMTEMASYAFMTQLVMDAVEAASSSVLVIGTVAACLAIRQAASAVAPMLQQSAHTAAHATASGMATPITRQATASLTDPVAAVTAGLAAVQQVFSDHAFFWVALITAVGCAAAFLRLQVFREWYYQEEYIPPPQDDDEE